jgi:hypothetical protein
LLGGTPSIRLVDLVTQLDHPFAKTLHRDKSKVWIEDTAWEKWLSATERNGAQLDDELIEEASVKKLPCKIASADDPDIFGASDFLHLSMDRSNYRL